MSDRFSLEGKTVFISGGTGGIAQGIAQGLADAGANIVLGSRRESVLSSIAEKINRTGRKALPVQLDITAIDSIRDAIEAAVKEFRSIDVLVNCAATNIRKPFLEVEESDYDEVMNVNAKGVYFMSQEVCRLMAQRKKGKIINIWIF